MLIYMETLDSWYQDWYFAVPIEDRMNFVDWLEYQIERGDILYDDGKYYKGEII